MVNIAGMTSGYLMTTGVVSITGMILNNLTAGGQHRRNNQINLLGERMVSMAGTSGQHHRNGWSEWIGLYNKTVFSLLSNIEACTLADFLNNT
jgi:hypothetical protein